MLWNIGCMLPAIHEMFARSIEEVCFGVEFMVDLLLHHLPP